MTKWMSLLRAFFPSWKFFDLQGHELRLEVSVGENGRWLNSLPPIKRSVANLFYNPRAGFLHAAATHLALLKADIEKSDANAPEALLVTPTYLITKNLAEFQILDLQLASQPFTYQFRVCADDAVILESPLHESVAPPERRRAPETRAAQESDS